MANWIIPCNPNYYNITSAFSTLSSIDWRQNVTNIDVGDIVYIYVSKPIQAILYKTVVRETNIPLERMDNSDEGFNLIDNFQVHERYMRLALVKAFPPEALSLEKMIKCGLKGNIQGQRRTGEIQKLIDEVEQQDKIETA